MKWHLELHSGAWGGQEVVTQDWGVLCHEFLAEESSSTCKVTCHSFAVFSVDIKDITAHHYLSKVRTVPWVCWQSCHTPWRKAGLILLPPFIHHQVNSYSVGAINHPCSVWCCVLSVHKYCTCFVSQDSSEELINGDIHVFAFLSHEGALILLCFCHSIWDLACPKGTAPGHQQSPKQPWTHSARHCLPSPLQKQNQRTQIAFPVHGLSYLV